MTVSVPRSRKKLLTIAAILCLIYSFHATIRIFVKIDHQCIGGKTNIKPNYDKRLIYSVYTNISKLTNVGTFNEEFAHLPSALPEEIKTDYFGCKDFAKLPLTRQIIEENTKGNRGISFIKVRIEGITISAVYKEANRILRTFADEYKYNTAKREIEYLMKLRGLPGIPRLFGSCIHDDKVGYLVERINGYTVCNDNGTTPKCSTGEFVTEAVASSHDPALAALRLAFTTTRLFKLLEERHLFFEDVSGVNLMFTHDFEIFLVDADSLVFYNDSRLFSKLLCSTDDHCPGPTGNLWVPESLNARIYPSCKDMYGICEYGHCRGFDVSMHACGMAEWYLCGLSKFFNSLPGLRKNYESLCTCLRQPHPQYRCSFATATEFLQNMLKNYK